MTINSEIRRAGPFVGNGVTTRFPFVFKVFRAEDLLVVSADADGVETSLDLDFDYTAELNPDQNANPGGEIITLAALPVGFTLTATSALDYLQPIDLTNQGGFYPRVINDGLDRLTIFAQQLEEGLGRSLKVPLSDGRTPQEYWGSRFDRAEENATAAAQSASEAKDYRDSTQVIADKFGDVDSAVSQTEAMRNETAGLTAIAESSAASAEVDAGRAETARDAAFVNADVYPDVATGRAAVANGEQFQVVEGDEIVRYRRDSASTQTEMARYSSAQFISNLSNAVAALIGMTRAAGWNEDILSLSFAENAYIAQSPVTGIIQPVTLAEAVSVTRASPKKVQNFDGSWTTVSVDTAAITSHFKERRGLLIERAATNLIEYSNEFENNWWTETFNTQTVIEAPNGLMEAYRNGISAPRTVASIHRPGLTVEGESSWACAVRTGTTPFMGVNIGTEMMMFDLNTFTAVTYEDHFYRLPATVTDYGSEPLADGWRTYYFTVSESGPSGGTVRVQPTRRGQAPGGGDPLDSTDYLDLWEMRYAAGGPVGSPITTSGSTATRAADYVVVNEIRLAPEGTFIVQHDARYDAPLLSFDNGAAFLRARQGEMVLTYDATGHTIYQDGVYVSHGGPLTIGSTLNLGCDNAGHINATIKTLRYIPRCQSSAEVWDKSGQYETDATILFMTSGGA